ncbi:MAG: hypothetical protein HUU35_20010, partial [Armatimonadetes bacterium]|nr:hypothetical protein [Armatimonadota bacterium]
MDRFEDEQLDALLAAPEAPLPPPALLARAREELHRRHRPVEDARQAWLARLAQVREDFRIVLSQPQFAGMALATRGGDNVGGVVAETDAALGHVVQGNNIRGQIFLTDLESPADLEVELAPAEGAATLECTRADEIGRFRFLSLDPGEYRLFVPELQLAQHVEIEACGRNDDIRLERLAGAVQFVEDGEDQLPGRAVEVAGRLVGQQQHRL